MAVVAAHGLRVSVPPRWEARLYRRDAALAVAVAARAAHPHAFGHPDELVHPVLHLANFALPPRRGDYGTGAVERMGQAHVFASLLEFDREEAGRPLFARRGLPRPVLRDFAANQLQRRLPGQLGSQTFFTHRDRAFCLYAVLGSRRHGPELVAELHTVLDALDIA